MLVASLEYSVLYRASISDTESFDGKRAAEFVNKDRQALYDYVLKLETQTKRLRKSNRELRQKAPAKSYIIR